VNAARFAQLLARPTALFSARRAGVAALLTPWLAEAVSQHIEGSFALSPRWASAAAVDPGEEGGTDRGGDALGKNKRAELRLAILRAGSKQLLRDELRGIGDHL
jgi:hypothetical protein